MGSLILLPQHGVANIIGTGAILIFLVVTLLLGYLLGSPEGIARSVPGMGTVQRNLSAALVVAAQNFSDDPSVLVMILVAGLQGSWC